MYFDIRQTPNKCTNCSADNAYAQLTLRMIPRDERVALLCANCIQRLAKRCTDAHDDLPTEALRSESALKLANIRDEVKDRVRGLGIEVSLKLEPCVEEERKLVCMAWNWRAHRIAGDVTVAVENWCDAKSDYVTISLVNQLKAHLRDYFNQTLDDL